ncbi:Uma2 family endonuclease [Microcoleus sp. LEGE 07076]|uniref:Uma2 family endonuclease n=1 Tax=Microcoleus sp. LEGE 07076 TaxID=915322 RepID=UPI00187F68CD|nr:Uma2 family endonuclease [Microcoleus sp. LEGE 07076]MBE9187328.1 Uma2 family endonuclease [Microcoleus sp. LEGE 07076]
MSVKMQRRLFTVQEYHLMNDAGIFGEDDRVELIEGEIIQMAAINTRHATCVRRLIRQFRQLPEESAFLDVQNPIQLNERTEPQPDVVLQQPRADYYETAHPIPSEVLLLVEVSDRTVDFDRDVKVPNYTSSGIQEVWLWDLEANCLEVYRNPTANGYISVQKFERRETVSPLAFPDFVLSIDGILG